MEKEVFSFRTGDVKRRFARMCMLDDYLRALETTYGVKIETKLHDTNIVTYFYVRGGSSETRSKVSKEIRLTMTSYSQLHKIMAREYTIEYPGGKKMEVEKFEGKVPHSYLRDKLVYTAKRMTGFSSFFSIGAKSGILRTHGGVSLDSFLDKFIEVVRREKKNFREGKCDKKFYSWEIYFGNLLFVMKSKTGQYQECDVSEFVERQKRKKIVCHFYPNFWNYLAIQNERRFKSTVSRIEFSLRIWVKNSLSNRKALKYLNTFYNEVTKKIEIIPNYPIRLVAKSHLVWDAVFPYRTTSRRFKFEGQVIENDQSVIDEIVKFVSCLSFDPIKNTVEAVEPENMNMELKFYRIKKCRYFKSNKFVIRFGETFASDGINRCELNLDIEGHEKGCTDILQVDESELKEKMRDLFVFSKFFLDLDTPDKKSFIPVDPLKSQIKQKVTRHNPLTLVNFSFGHYSRPELFYQRFRTGFTELKSEESNLFVSLFRKGMVRVKIPVCETDDVYSFGGNYLLIVCSSDLEVVTLPAGKDDKETLLPQEVEILETLMKSNAVLIEFSSSRSTFLSNQERSSYFISFRREFIKSLGNLNVVCYHEQVSKEKLFNELDFNKKFELQSILDVGYVLNEFDDEVLKLCKRRSIRNVSFVANLIRTDVPPPSEFLRYFKKTRGMSSEYLRENSLARVRNIDVHPYKIVVKGSFVERSCRFFREFINPEYVFRVDFKNFRYFKRVSLADKEENPFGTNLKRLMHNGFEIFGEKLVFLACSSSSLRKGSAIFTLESKYPLDVIERIGKIQTKCVAKKISRIGLCFSSSVPSVRLPIHLTKTIDDIVVKVKWKADHELSFTNGCGTISPNLAKSISEKMRLPSIPSAFQIRYAGFKGVLVVDKSMEKGNDLVHFRKSMKKFDSKSDVLEIVNISRFHPCFLNRQVIFLMNNIGITREYFEKITESFLDRIEEKWKRNSFIGQTIVSYGCDLIRSIGEIFNVCGEPMTKSDPFLCQFQCKFLHSMVKCVKEDQRIPIQQGAILKGVFDFTLSLEEGEVFISTQTEEKSEIFECEVMVSKNPCHHPGDIRILKAVRNDNLKTLKNVIVFSTKGKIPETFKTSGSDLDGDLYFIMKVPDKFIGQLSQKKYMEFETSKKEQEEEVTEKDMMNFFVEYYFSSNVGQCANSHLVTCDMDGVESKMAIDLAKSCRISIDHATTGVGVKIQNESDTPHYLKRKGRYYMSTSVVADIYDLVKTPESVLSWNESTEIIVDKNMIVEGYEKHVGRVKEILIEYNEIVCNVVQKYGFHSDVDFLSEISGSKVKYKPRKDIINLLHNLVCSWREELFFNTTLMEITEKLSCMYVVCYQDSKNSPMKILSFPWVVGGRMWKKFWKLKETFF